MKTHTQTCYAQKEYYRNHPDGVVEKRKRTAAVKSGKALVTNAVFTDKRNSLNELINRIRDDEVEQIVVSFIEKLV